MTQQSINYKELLALHSERVAAEIRMKERHIQEVSALDRHYKKMMHDIWYPPRQR